MVNGKILVREGQLVNESIYKLIPRHNEISLRLIEAG